MAAAPPLNETILEKGITRNVDASPSASVQKESLPPEGFFAKLNSKVLSINKLEARGIERVLPSERHEATTAGYAQMALLWFSTNLTVNNLAIGLLGPLVFGLSFVDSALLSVFGGGLGCAGAAYMSTYGPASGNRTMVIARYFMGYYPSKIACFLNIVIMVGYGVLDCIIGGQILSAVGNGSVTVIAGIIIVAVISLVVATFGMSVFHLYERWAWIPQLIALFVLVGSAGPKFDTTYASEGTGATLSGDRLSFFSLCLSAPVAWTPSAADYYVYYPESTKRWKTFTLTLLGMWSSFIIVYLLGAGLASGTFSNPDWNDAYEVSSGQLVMAGYAGLGGFGSFLGVVLALGVIANNIPGTYSAALGIQVMGRYGERVPRWALTFIVVLIYTACALGGRDHFFEIFENFLALMGYWVCIYLVIVFEEDLIFRRNKGYDWSAWADKAKLPIGAAGLAAFLVGWAGAIVCMDQVWYVGPIAGLVGDYGSDLGIWVGSAWAMVVFPPLRVLELKFYGR